MCLGTGLVKFIVLAIHLALLSWRHRLQFWDIIFYLITPISSSSLFLFFLFCSFSGTYFYSNLNFFGLIFPFFFFLLIFSHFNLIDILCYFNGYFHKFIHQSVNLIFFAFIFLIFYLFSDCFFFIEFHFCFMITKQLISPNR